MFSGVQTTNNMSQCETAVVARIYDRDDFEVERRFIALAIEPDLPTQIKYVCRRIARTTSHNIYHFPDDDQISDGYYILPSHMDWRFDVYVNLSDEDRENIMQAVDEDSHITNAVCYVVRVSSLTYYSTTTRQLNLNVQYTGVKLEADSSGNAPRSVVLPLRDTIADSNFSFLFPHYSRTRDTLKDITNVPKIRQPNQLVILEDDEHNEENSASLSYLADRVAHIERYLSEHHT